MSTARMRACVPLGAGEGGQPDPLHGGGQAEALHEVDVEAGDGPAGGVRGDDAGDVGRVEAVEGEGVAGGLLGHVEGVVERRGGAVPDVRSTGDGVGGEGPGEVPGGDAGVADDAEDGPQPRVVGVVVPDVVGYLGGGDFVGAEDGGGLGDVGGHGGLPWGGVGTSAGECSRYGGLA